MEYLGEPLSANEVENRYPKKTVGVYCLGLSSSRFLDAALFRGVGALANGSKRGIKPNAQFSVASGSDVAHLVSTCRISAGNEIIVSYGDDYWRSARHYSLYNQCS